MELAQACRMCCSNSVDPDWRACPAKERCDRECSCKMAVADHGDRLKRATRHRFASRRPRNRRRRRQVTVELLQSAYWRVATLLGRWAKFIVHTRNIG